jgi:hypothetical protein
LNTSNDQAKKKIIDPDDNHGGIDPSLSDSIHIGQVQLQMDTFASDDQSTEKTGQMCGEALRLAKIRSRSNRKCVVVLVLVM